MADDAPSPSKSVESPAPAENDATTIVAPSPTKDTKAAGKAANRNADEDVEMKSGDEDTGERDDEEKKDKSSSKKDGANAEDNDEENADKTQQEDDEKENASAAATSSKRSHKRKTSELKTPTRRKSVSGAKDKDNNGTPAKPSNKKAALTREYKPEDLVLHKLKGYPQWPAVILSDEVAELKPELIKAKPGSKSRAKAAEDTVRQSYPIAYLHNLLELYVILPLPPYG